LGKPQSQQNTNEEKHQNEVSNDQKIQKEEFFKDIVNMERVFEVLFQSEIQHLAPYCKKDVSLPNDHLNLLELAQKIGITNERDEIEMQNLKTFRNESENAKCDCCKKIYSISNKSPGDHPCKACNDHYVCRGCLSYIKRLGSTNNCPVENCNENLDNCSRNKKYFDYSVMETSIKRLIREKEMEVMKRAKDIRMILEKAIEYVQYGFVLDEIRKDISNQEHPNHKNFIHELHEISCGNTNLDNEYHLNRVSKVFGLKLSEQKYLRKRVLMFLAIDFKHGLRKKRLAKFQNDEDTAKKVVAISSVIQRAAEAGISVFAVTEILKVGLAGGLASIGGAAMFIIECAWTIWKIHKRSDLTPKQKIHMYRVKIAATFLRNGTALGLSISSFFIGGAVGAVIGIGSGPLLPIFCLVFGCIGYGIGTLSAKLLVHYFPDEDKKRLQQHSAMLVLAFKRLLPETFERHEMLISTEPETAKKIYLPRLKKEFRKLLLESENDEHGCVKLSLLWQKQCLESHLISIEENKAWICKEVRKECKRQWKMIKRDTYEISVKKLKRYLNHSTRIAEQGG